MAIVCGTDFSEPAAGALMAAARLAARMHMPLHVVHAVELAENDLLDEPKSAYVRWTHNNLEHNADRLRALGAHVTVHVTAGAPDDALLAAATEVSAKLIVVAALGKRRPGKWQLGSHADRLAQRAHVPVLVVRNSEPFSAWAEGARPLRIALGADLTASAKAAMRFVEQLRELGPCEVIGIHLYWPPSQFQRLGLSGARSYLAPDLQVSTALERELRQHLTGGSDSIALKLRLEPHVGRIGDRLASVAQEESADLLVVGSHDRSAIERLWEGSVSRGALHNATLSVACVPALAPANPSLWNEAPRVRNILVATDFSAVGNAAVPLAYAVAGEGATVHLVHVVLDGDRPSLALHDVLESPAATAENPAHDAARRQLGELVPHGAAGALSAGKSTRLHILESNRTAEAICQAAERLDADLVCVGTHGRTGVTKAVLGSIAQAVMEHTKRPVLFARKPPE